MKVHGFCTACRRVKRVQVSGAGMSNLSRGGTASGICDACQQAEDDARRSQNGNRSR